jgi:hypothetical protein
LIRKAKHSKKVWVKKDLLKGSEMNENVFAPPKDIGPSLSGGMDGVGPVPLFDPCLNGDMQSDDLLMGSGVPVAVHAKDLGEVDLSEKESGVVPSPCILMEAPCNSSLQRTQIELLNVPEEGEVSDGIGFQKEICLPLVNIAQNQVLKVGSFVSGEIEDILSVSQDVDVGWGGEGSEALWTTVGKHSKGRKKGNKKDEFPALVKNNKKGSKAEAKDGDSNPVKGKHGSSAKIGGDFLENGDVGSSPTSVGRPSNMHKRTTEANRSIADGCQWTILESKHFLKS